MSDSSLGAIVTHAHVTDDGEYIIAAESGYVMYWKVEREKVVFKEQQKDILQIIHYDDKRKCLFISKMGPVGDMKALCIARSVPQGERLFEFDFPYKQYKNIILSSDEQYFIGKYVVRSVT